MWAALTNPNCNEAAEQQDFCRNEGQYKQQLPRKLKPWVQQLLGRDFIHLGLAAGQEPDLYRELAFLLELLKLHVAVDKEKPHLKQELELLGWLAEADPRGPWAELAALAQGNNVAPLRGELQSLLLLLQRVQLFVPAKLMKLLGVEVGACRLRLEKAWACCEMVHHTAAPAHP
jgi:hypothetical protein